MKKIMFNDKYGLTEAVLKGNKTMTRRIIPIDIYNATDWKAFKEGDIKCYSTADGDFVDIRLLATYRVGEVVAVAQSYKDIGYTKKWVEQHIKPNPNAKCTDPFEKKYPGWNNKMFVPSAMCKHKIRITDIKVERLQDIRDEDCLKEGVTYNSTYWIMGYQVKNLWNKYDRQSHFRSARVAFAALIDKISGKGTFEKNPYVFAYSFELVK